MFHFLQTDREYSQVNTVGYFMLKLLNMLRHVSKIKLYRLSSIFNVFVCDQLLNIILRLSILPVNIQRPSCLLYYFLDKFRFGYLNHLFDFTHRRFQVIYYWYWIQVIIFTNLPVFTNNIIPFLQNVDVFLHLSVFRPSFKIL